MNESKVRKQRFNVTGVCFILLISLISTNYLSAMAVKGPRIAEGSLPFVVPDVKEPKFPNKTFKITDFGAVGDGHTKNTEAIAKAIDACAKAGGGKVLVPAGLWLTGPIVFKSNINLHLEEGAIILFSPKLEDYPLIKTIWEGEDQVRCTSPLYADRVENIAITGTGIIDGAGQAWRPVKKWKMTDRQWKKLLDSGGTLGKERDGTIWWPSEGALNGRQIVEELRKKPDTQIEEYAAAGEYLRPVMVSFQNCKNVLLDGPTFQNSPAWNIHPLLCENVIVRNLIIRNPWYSQNGDGLDVESCKNVIVYNCRFDVGDDAICMKSGKDEYGRKRGKPTENVAIWDCTVYHGHGGFVVGSEMSGGVRNIYINNCSFLGTDVGIRFKTTRGRGGVVENIYVQNIRMKDIPTDAVRFNMYYTRGSENQPIPPVTEETPRFQNIHMKNIVCDGADRVIQMQGLPEMPVRNVSFENIVMSGKKGVACIKSEDVKFKNVKIIPDEYPAFKVNDCKNILLDRISAPDTSQVLAEFKGSETEQVYLKGLDKSEIEERLTFSEDMRPEAVVIE
ncbi:MAG: glycoside hydrolase family 28 protein [Sedimentisphaerales bacterium]|nr:glycoside hydrolase family 28 protein [Sedimentisphaerales bacterium]